MKKILLHIVTPFVGIISFFIGSLLVALILRLMQFINCMGDWWVDNLPFFGGMMITSTMINLIAPSKRLIHFILVGLLLLSIVVLITIFVNPEEYGYAPSILTGLGYALGIFLSVITKADEQI